MMVTFNIHGEIDGDRIRLGGGGPRTAVFTPANGWALYNADSQLVAAVRGVEVPYPNVTGEMAIRYILTGDLRPVSWDR